MGVATAIAAVTVSAIGMVSQGIAARNQARFESEVAMQQANRERLIAKQEEEDFRRRASRMAAASRAVQGGGAREVGEGTSLLLEQDFIAREEEQAGRIRAGGATRALRNEQSAALSRSQGSSSMMSGLIRGGAGLLSGVNSALG